MHRAEVSGEEGTLEEMQNEVADVLRGSLGCLLLMVGDRGVELSSQEQQHIKSQTLTLPIT